MKYVTMPMTLIVMIVASALAWGQEGSDTKTLAKMLSDKSAESAKKFPPELLAKFKKGIEAVRSTEGTAKQVGDAAVDATLSNFDGQSVQLSALWKKSPVVLQWYRGGW